MDERESKTVMAKVSFFGINVLKVDAVYNKISK